MATKQGDLHETYVVTTATTRAEPKCALCKRIDASGTLKKRLIVCCDGTSNSSNQGVETHPTNVARLSRAIANVGRVEDGSPEGRQVPQITYYQAGIGTDPTISEATKMKQQSFGVGLNVKVCEAYNYLANNYGPGDEIFVFGFSRGAYTARVLASFVCQFGLLSPGMMDYFDEIFDAYKKRTNEETSFEDMAWSKEYAKPGELGLRLDSTEKITRWEAISQYTHLHVKIRVIGVFDTVGSVGLSGRVPQPGQDVDWHSTSLHPKMEYAFHALAVDESRGNFAPTLFYRYDQCSRTVLKQCWFPGYHGDNGGHSDAAWETNSIDLLTFAWMIDQLTEHQLLQFSVFQLYWPVLKRVHSGEEHKPDSKKPASVEEASERRIQWSDGRVIDTNTPWPFYMTSFIATRRLWFKRTPGLWKQAYQGKVTPYQQLCETIHPTVAHRMKQKRLDYQPAGLDEKEWKYVEGTSATGGIACWVHTVDGEEIARIPEEQLPEIPKQKLHGKSLWTGSLQRYLAPKDYLGDEVYEQLKTELEAQVADLTKKMEL